jgi:hypothetical protein
MLTILTADLQQHLPQLPEEMEQATAPWNLPQRL